jgi:hypothetical protein
MEDPAWSEVDMSRQPGDGTYYILNTLKAGTLPQFEVEVLRGAGGSKLRVQPLLPLGGDKDAATLEYRRCSLVLGADLSMDGVKQLVDLIESTWLSGPPGAHAHARTHPPPACPFPCERRAAA